MKTFKITVTHHYGDVTETIKAQSKKQALIQILRKDHEFLTDDNHTVKINKNSVEVFKNENSPAFALAPSWVEDGSGARWFSMRYRMEK